VFFLIVIACRDFTGNSRQSSCSTIQEIINVGFSPWRRMKRQVRQQAS
jgi:hypothetical protein